VPPARHAAPFAALLTLLTGAPSIESQSPPLAGQSPPFRSGVDAVTVNVTVTDGSRRYVTDLGRDNFVLLEDGRPQQITVFRQTGVSLAVALLIDTSASMRLTLPLAQQAALGFVRELASTDVAAVFDVDSRVGVAQDFTNDRASLERAIQRTRAGGTTALYDALYIALKELKKTIRGEPFEDPRRRAIVVLSDGEDTSSLVSFDEVQDTAARSDTAVYAIGLFAPTTATSPWLEKPHEAEFVLRRLAQQTGGRAFFPTDAKELRAIYAAIKAELSNQYFLGYESSNPRRDGAFRRIAVRVDRPGVVARARPGYYAALDRTSSAGQRD
jgi:Ca-activated chloride channel family protein